MRRRVSVEEEKAGMVCPRVDKETLRAPNAMTFALG